MTKKEQWENVDSETQRMKLPDGWLVRTWKEEEWGYLDDGNNNGSISIAMVYVQDPGHSWTLDGKRKTN